MIVKETPIVVVTGISCVFFWVVAYFGIIYRGFRDRTFGVPIAAFAANISWEASYAFFLDPLGDHIHLLTIPCFFIDLVIAWQCWTYGSRDFDSTYVHKYFHVVFVAAVVVAFPVVYLAFSAFRDPLGEYTGFGINFMMSYLFIGMLMRRGGPAGQSVYIAVSKWLGTLFAWIATAFTVTTSHADPLPDSPWSFLSGSFTHAAYPLTHLINVLYGVIFCVDIVYIVLLYQSLKKQGVSPWRRF